MMTVLSTVCENLSFKEATNSAGEGVIPLGDDLRATPRVTPRAITTDAWSDKTLYQGVSNRNGDNMVKLFSTEV